MSTRLRHESEAFEQAIIDAVPLELDHVPDDVATSHDAWLLEDVDADRVDVTIPAGSEVEIKTCLRWIDDSGSNGGRRRGRWFVGRRAHRALLRLGGVYLFAVLDDAGELITWTLESASTVDELLVDRWTSNGDGHRQGETSAQLPWPEIFEPVEVGGV